MVGCVPRFLVLELWQWRIMPVSNALADASASAAVSAVSSAGAPPPALATLGGRVVASRLCSTLVVRLLSAVTSAGAHGRSAVVSTSLLELRAELCEMMMDAIASAALLITTLSLARAGGRAVSILGWLPGLFLLLHATPRR
jgi:crotonobetainyl-CoA:carnitine CoA-transferase CaiB-like acyl-CoA transferase